jgi:hypothetical protein
MSDPFMDGYESSGSGKKFQFTVGVAHSFNSGYCVQQETFMVKSVLSFCCGSDGCASISLAFASPET